MVPEGPILNLIVISRAHTLKCVTSTLANIARTYLDYPPAAANIRSEILLAFDTLK